jgi:phosphatidylglycerophosphatase A
VVKRFSEIVATCLYIGHVPIVPATFGAAFGAVVFALAMPERASVQLVVTLALIALAIFTSGKAEERYGHDGRPIVIDEVAGMFVSLCFLPRDGSLSPVSLFAGAFILFRVFDIVKPYPARSLQELRGGWGVVLDDVVAGVYANVCMRVAILLAGGG